MKSFLIVALALSFASPAYAASKSSSESQATRPPSATEQESFSAFSSAEGRLGLSVVSMTPELRHYFGAPANVGVLVERVEPNSPGARAGVRVGDVVTDVADRRVRVPDDMLKDISNLAAGRVVSLRVLRNDRSEVLAAKLDDAPIGRFAPMLQPAWANPWSWPPFSAVMPGWFAPFEPELTL
jgi:S1-C subfamily serine protease